MPLQDFIKTLPAALLGTAVDFTVEAISEVLNQIEEGRNGVFAATGASLKLDGAAVSSSDARTESCIVIYRGLQGTIGDSVKGSGKLTKKALEGLGMADVPAFYIEFSVVQIKTQKADNTTIYVRRIEPQHIHYAQSAAHSIGSGSKQVTLALAVGLTKTPKDLNDETLKTYPEVHRFDFGRLMIGNWYEGGSDLSSIGSGGDFYTAATASNLVAVVAETDKKSAALAILRKAFDANKEALKKELREK